MNILVIGGTGFIGSHVTRLLAAHGHRVAVLHRGNTAEALAPAAHQIVGDCNALAAVRTDVARFEPSVVVDLILYTARQAQELVKLARGIAERVVAVSSADVYRNYEGLRGRTNAPPDPVPLREDAPLRETLYPYRGDDLPFDWADDYDKILVERIVSGDTELTGTLLRLPAVYGPGDRQRRIGTYLDLMDAERSIFMAREQAAWRWTRAYVEDVASAIALATVDRRAAGRVYNVGEKSALTEKQWVEEIARTTDWRGEVCAVPAEDLPEHRRQPLDFRYELMTDTTRIREELGYSEPVGRDEGLRRASEWERSRRMTS